MATVEESTSHLVLRIADLEEQLAQEREFHRAQLTAVQWARERRRFHAFDAIKNDACPACGARVRVIDRPDPEGVQLEAIQ